MKALIRRERGQADDVFGLWAVPHRMLDVDSDRPATGSATASANGTGLARRG
ncbi:hypothetical protein ABT040_35745 [Streptomyces sp. NPDC002688]|uniref:hypothetical protein n=1 Tax=Streptomyces sp. NPDC002688 TaxID=3154423 RepID=UPI00331DF21F